MFKKFKKTFKDMFEGPITKDAKEDVKKIDEVKTTKPTEGKGFKTGKDGHIGELVVRFNDEVDKSKATLTTEEGKQEGVSVLSLVSNGDDGYALMCAGDRHKITTMLVEAVGNGHGPFRIVKDMMGGSGGAIETLLKGAIPIKGSGALKDLLEKMHGDIEPKDELDKKANTSYDGKKTVH